jgi:hypothetical protein
MLLGAASRSISGALSPRTSVPIFKFTQFAHASRALSSAYTPPPVPHALHTMPDDPHTPRLTSEEVAAYARDGYLVVRGVVRREELEASRRVFDDLMLKRIPVVGKDHGEHTPGLMNVTAFTLYHAMSSLGIFEAIDRRCAGVARQLLADPAAGLEGEIARPLGLEYTQLLRKLPNRPSAVFSAHTDMSYWPRSHTPGRFDMRTATCSVAVNRAGKENGCLWVLPGSHTEAYRGKQGVLAGSRPDGGGVIDVQLLPGDEGKRVFLELEAGDMTVHNEAILHGSEGNASPSSTRDTLILAYRALSMIALERAVGFRHSYNDGDEVLQRVRYSIWD